MRKRLVWLILIATLVAAYFAPRAEEVVVMTPAKAAIHTIQKVSLDTRGAQRAEPGEVELQIRPRQSDQDLGNVFASHSWAPAPEPSKKISEEPAPPPPPEAPPLPFRFLGRLVEDGKTAYFLQFNDRNLVMHIGDTVDKTYVLEGSNGGTLTFAYLPLNKKQTLAVGEVD
jgi:hypothetical protein